MSEHEWCNLYWAAVDEAPVPEQDAARPLVNGVLHYSHGVSVYTPNDDPDGERVPDAA